MDTNTCCPCPETLAMTSIPKQNWCEPYDYRTALTEGTIFPCLNLPFFKAEIGDSTLNTATISANPEENEREQMLTEISIISFAINDLTLYLDTHPNCQNGLSLFKELLKKRLKLLADFADKFYPLTQISMIVGENDTNCYGWDEGPAPWEGGLI
ncbi:MAG: spore coat protein CotJB [Lachnospiraceae bacterium]|nr:spore coat protein CotJB [Lachnospiraceae bacterium]